MEAEVYRAKTSASELKTSARAGAETRSRGRLTILVFLINIALSVVLSSGDAYAQQFGVYALGRAGLQGTEVVHSPNVGIAMGVELGAASLAINANAHLFIGYDVYRSGLVLVMNGAAIESKAWHTDSVLMVRAFSAGLKYRTSDSLAKSCLFGAVGVVGGYEQEWRATITRTNGVTEEIGFPGRWSLGVVGAIGGELMIADRFGIVGEVRRMVFFGPDADDRPNTLSFSVGIVANVLL